jgi:hypothetical protein
VLHCTATAGFEMTAGRLYARLDGGDDTGTAVFEHLDLFPGKRAFHMAAIRQNTKPRLIKPFNDLGHLFRRILFAIKAA